MNNGQRLTGLVWLLRFNGILLSVAVVAVVLPVDTMTRIHSWLGLGEFPVSPITLYLARSLSAFYAVHGFLSLYIAQTIRRNWHWVPILAGMHFCLAVVFFGTDISSKMPWWWTWFEGPPIALFCVILFYLWVTTDPDVEKK
jgi:hypothetical protein